jgi:hypothetical protein
VCTLTIEFAASGFTATMNRDEALVRAPEVPPKTTILPTGVHWTAPRDSEKGGTWMGLNNYGVVGCLLNAYQPGESLLPDPNSRYRSRGEIIPRLLEHTRASEAIAAFQERFTEEAYPSFHLYVVCPQSAICVTWLRGHALQVDEITEPWVIRSSSGWDSAEVAQWREERFRAWIEAGTPRRGTLPEFHVLQEPGREDYSPLMKREWSATRSITQAVVDPGAGELALRYWPQPTPETAGPTSCVHLKTPAGLRPGSAVSAGHGR